MRIEHVIFLISLCLQGFKVFSQEKIALEFIPNLASEINLKIPKNFKDSSSVTSFLSATEIKMRKKGYLLFSIDSISRADNQWNAYVYLGPAINELHLSIDEENRTYLKKKSSINEKLLTNIPLTSVEVEKTMNAILRAYLSTGYPFANIRLNTPAFQEDGIFSELIVEKGPYYEFNKITIKGDSLLSPKLIGNLVSLKTNSNYNELLVRKIDQKIAQVNYLKTRKPTEVLFRPEGAEVFMYLERIPISSVNGIVGFQPNSVTGKLDLTGEINLKLTNALNRGEKIQLQWQSIRDKTQNLQSNFAYPYLFNSNFGIEGKFDLYKRDSTFLELKYRSAVNYFLTNSTFISGFYEGYRSNPLSGSKNNNTFSNIGSAAVNLYGIGLNSYSYDYLPNPRKGYRIELEGGLGNRIYRANDTLPSTKTPSFKGRVQLELFVPIYRKHILRLASETEFTGSDAGVFQNELFRFGGQQSQRGFNEDELFASTRSTQTIEYRFLLDKNAFLFVFLDQTWYENNSSDFFSDSPVGFGTGISFSTGLGIFSLSYALGKQFDNPIRLADGKIHFGYIAYF